MPGTEDSDDRSPRTVTVHQAHSSRDRLLAECLLDQVPSSVALTELLDGSSAHIRTYPRMQSPAEFQSLCFDTLRYPLWLDASVTRFPCHLKMDGQRLAQASLDPKSTGNLSQDTHHAPDVPVNQRAPALWQSVPFAELSAFRVPKGKMGVACMTFHAVQSHVTCSVLISDNPG
ncbi:hypothetical protein BaRGS_00014344, partial [Batillaria attramentaria]